MVMSVESHKNQPDLISRWYRMLIKLRSMRQAGHVARMVEREEVHTIFWRGNRRVKIHLKELGLNGRIILKWVFKKWDWGHGLD
jgi:hypothetical protein